MLRSCLRLTAVVLLVLVSAACAAKGSAPLQAAPMAVAAVPVTAPQTSSIQLDPVLVLIGLSTQHFESGERALQEGHLDTAKAEFDRALDVVLESTYGAQSEARIREHFTRLVERISAYEVAALALGDGFAEKRYEAAGIDDLLALSTGDQPASAETEKAVSEDLKTTVHDIDIPLNAKVLRYVQLFSGRLKSYLEEGLARGAQYLPMIQEVFRAEGLPLDLAYVPLIESAFKPTAMSRARAAGIWQFMHGTALENGLVSDWYIDERAEPEKATLAAAKYLKTLHRMFGDWHLALASYNGGPGRVQRAIKRSGRQDFWKLTATTRYLPRETRDYVPLILAAVIVARNPGQYGLNVEPIEAPRYERVALYQPVDLRRIAEWAGVPVQAIQDLNPELRRWTTPVRADVYELKVPEGTAAGVLAGLASTAPEEQASFSSYTVRQGETISTIARNLKVSGTDLAEANYLSTRAKLNVGQQLIIPRPPTTLLATAPKAEPAGRTPDVVRASATPTAPAADRKLTHQVKRGETLFSIARLYRTTVSAIKEWNRLKGSAIQAGQRLTVFQPIAVATN